MQSLIKELQDLFSNVSQSKAEITPATKPQFGHYQYNSAMRLAKLQGTSPRSFAENIAKEINHPLIEKLEVAGPGFINIHLNPKELAKRIQHTVRSDSLYPKAEKKRIIIDFSSPNTAKEMHVGHLRSTIIGDALARHLEALGHDVLRLNHIGDWGTAFGMLIAYIREEHPLVFEGKEAATLSDLVRWYKESKVRFDLAGEFKKLAQLEVVKLQSGDRSCLQAWEIICSISRAAYQEIYDLLDVHLNERGESYYNPMLASTISELEEKGLVTLSEGAKCLFAPGFTGREGEPLPLMLQKSDGGYNYDTTDMAAIKQRLFEEKGDWLIYVTDAGQHTHFMMIFAAAEMAGWLNKKKVRVDHVPFGLVLGSDGKKFRTRTGETEKLIDLIHTAIEKAASLAKEKNPDFTNEEAAAVGKVLGIGAIKYADLSTNRVGDYQFSYDKMLKFEGNTAAYLLYSYVRVNGIKRKAAGLDTHAELNLEHPSEIALAVQLLQFSEAIEAVTEELMPNRMTDYLYNLADKFNAFFRDCRIAGSPEEKSRLLLAEATARTLKAGLHLLGIQTTERM